MLPGSPPIEKPRRSGCLTGCLRGCLATLVTIPILLVIVSALVWLFFSATPFSAFRGLPVDEAIEQIAQSVMADLGEQPATIIPTRAAVYPIDSSVPDALVPPLIAGFDLMRSTPEGDRLFDLLVEQNVSVSVEPLAYNAGYTSSSWTARGWRSSRIVIASDLVQSRETDVLATVLVHEATHAERAISGVACYYTDDCETLPNGIEIDEEIAAHAAEARFWEALYGEDGKRFAFGTAAGENALLEAYRQGTRALADYVRAFRGDRREGADVPVLRDR